MDLSKSWIACVAPFINPLQSIEGNDVHNVLSSFEEDSRRVYVFSVIHFRIVDKRVDITRVSILSQIGTKD